MNTIIPQENSQALTPDENQVMLAWNTNLMEKMMPQETEEPQTQENVPQEAEKPEMAQESQQPQNEPISEDKEPEKDFNKEFDSFKGEIKGLIDTKFDDLTKTIKDALE